MERNGKALWADRVPGKTPVRKTVAMVAMVAAASLALWAWVELHDAWSTNQREQEAEKSAYMRERNEDYLDRQEEAERNAYLRMDYCWDMSLLDADDWYYMSPSISAWVYYNCPPGTIDRAR